MPGVKQTVERRQLGMLLKRLRAESNVAQAAAARAIGRKQTQLSRVEAGQGSLSVEQLTVLLDLYGAGKEDREVVLSLGVQARKRQRGRTYTDELPGGFQRLAALEADAVAIRSYEVGVIPGLIQSPDYVRRSLGSASGIWWEESDDELDNRVRFRLERQQLVLDSEKTRALHFIFGEEALRHVVGDRSIMRGQVLHLLALLERLNGLTVQIIPTDTPDNPAPGGGFMVLDYASSPRIGFVSITYGPSIYHDQDDDTDVMLRAFEHLSALALSPEQTRSLLIAELKET